MDVNGCKNLNRKAGLVSHGYNVANIYLSYIIITFKGVCLQVTFMANL